MTPLSIRDDSILISVHMPKTAGSSFLSILERHYGNTLQRDYDDLPLHRSASKRKMGAIASALSLGVSKTSSEETRCVHGHFLPVKYRYAFSGLRKVYVTWLRDPVERLASHYYYWTRQYDPTTAGRLHCRVVEEGWSLEQFCFSSEMRNVYSAFLWGFPLSRFDFIGITEDFGNELARFSEQILGYNVEQSVENVNPSKVGSSYIQDSALRREIEKFHSLDMSIYRSALNQRKNFDG